MKQKTTLLNLIAALFITTSLLNAQTLVAHYKFDGNLNDETGNWNLQQSVPFDGFLAYETGQDGTADGAVYGFTSPDFLETTAAFTPISGSTSRTMAAWVKTTVSGTQAIVGLGQKANYEKWTWSLSNAVTVHRVEIQASGFSGPTSLNDGTWHHVASVYDDATKQARLYLDGQFELSADWTANPPNTLETALRVANDFHDSPTPTRGFGGSIDDLRIYTGAADDAFILALYNSTVLAVNEVTQETFNAYPNPVKDRLYFTTNKIASVEIYNLLGAKIVTQTILNNGVDMSLLPKGLYLVKCKDNRNMDIATIKAIKQ